MSLLQSLGMLGDADLGFRLGCARAPPQARLFRRSAALWYPFGETVHGYRSGLAIRALESDRQVTGNEERSI